MKQQVIIILSWIYFLILCGCAPKAPSQDSGVPYDSGMRTQTISVYQAPVDSTIPVTRSKGQQGKWLCEFYPKRIRFLYNSGKDSVNITYDSEREIRNNEILSPLGINFDNKQFAFQRDPAGLQDYSERTAPNADSTFIHIKHKRILYEGYLVKVKK